RSPAWTSASKPSAPIRSRASNRTTATSAYPSASPASPSDPDTTSTPTKTASLFQKSRSEVSRVLDAPPLGENADCGAAVFVEHESEALERGRNCRKDLHPRLPDLGLFDHRDLPRAELREQLA